MQDNSSVRSDLEGRVLASPALIPSAAAIEQARAEFHLAIRAVELAEERRERAGARLALLLKRAGLLEPLAPIGQPDALRAYAE